MPYGFAYFVARLQGKAAIVYKTVELFDDLVTFSVHALSLDYSFTNTDRSRRLAGRYCCFEKRAYNPGKFANQFYIGCICYVRIISIRSGFERNKS